MKAFIINGLYTIKHDPWRIQFYWPELLVKQGEFSLYAPTCLRIVYSNYNNELYIGIGFQLLGFGIGIDGIKK